jgi:hypothetical protein
MTPQQRDALKQALEQHSLSMAVKDAAPEDVAALPQDFAVPTYNANNQPLYDNQLFPAVNSAEDLVAQGYATPDGQVTERGQMALSLRRVGALNDDYTLNDTGKTLMASRDDLLKEENLPLYMKSKELELDDVGELSWGEVAGNFLSELKKGGKNLIDLAGYDTSSMTPEEKASFDLQAQSAVGGLVKAGTILPIGFSQIVGNATIKAISDNEEEEKLALAQFNQKFEKKSDEINNAKTAEVVDAMGQMLGAELGMAEARQQDIQTVGAERAQELESGGESAGGVAAMFTPGGPSMLTAKVAFGVAGKGLGAAFKPISRSLLQADAKAAMVLDKTKQLATLERQAGALQLTTQAAERQAAIGESMAQKFSQAGFTDRANNALRLANQARTKGQEAAVRLGGFTDEIAAVSDDLAKVTSDATVADKVLQMTQKASQMPYLPITGIGKALEYTGRGMIGIDKGLSTLAAKVGADKAYNAMNKITTLSGLGGVGVATGFGPAAFIPAAIKATWSTAPFIKATGEYVGLMGKEAMKARGQIGFWKRMYEMPNKGPMHRAVSGLMDTATLGGRVTGAAGRVGKGLAASYPVDLAFEWVAEGGEMNPNVLKQAAVETLVFGGTGAALGGITMGSAERIRSLQNGDATNFYRSLTDPSQRVMFNGMAPDMKRVIGTFSASNPGAKIEFTTQGEGAYDRNTKTVMVNPSARNPLKPLLTHEFMHHMLNNGIGDGVVANLVGDGYQTGGLLRGKDGQYEPQYEAFKQEYVDRLQKQHERQIKMRDAIGDPVSKSEREFRVPDEKYLAEEYFIETNVDDMLGLVESGKLGKMAGRMVLNDKVRALGDAILNKSAIIRDLHFRIGGVMDGSGKMVKGNGFLGGQLYQSPEVRRMFKKMVNESIGRRGGIDAAKMKARNGIEININGKTDPILGELSSLWETDADGNPLVDKKGEYIPLSKETDELRSNAGMLLVDDLRARQSRGESIPDGELAYNPDNNTWSGQYLNDKQIELLSLSGRFNSKQIKQLKMLNAAAKATSDPNADPATRGHRFSVMYQAALKKNKKGQWRYDQIKPQLRDIVPYGVEISKDGNVLYRIMSTNQLFANASEKATSKRGRSLYQGNMESILRDANKVIDLHGKNEATDAYFKSEYPKDWEDRKKFINSVFGNVGAGHKDINPLVASDRVDAVVKSYRLDRMNKATQLVGATQLPYQNNLIKINYLPEGEPILDENGEPKDLRYTPSYEDRQVRMPEAQRAMPEGVSPEDLNPVANKQEAQGLWADGKQMFAINEMDEKLIPITSKAMLDSYSADAIGWMEPEAQTRFMPEGEFTTPNDRVQKGYDYGYLDGLSRDPNTNAVQFTRPIGKKEALPLMSERPKIINEADIESFQFTDPANVSLYLNNGKKVRFKFDPTLLEKPETKDFAKEHAGKRIQLAMADRHTATGGDMGGVLYPWLKSNQVTIVGDDGIEYKAVWANNAWKPVLSMRKKAFDQGIFDLAVYIMGPDAHGSNLRTVRTVSNEIDHANISQDYKDVLLYAANYGVKRFNTSYYTAEIAKKNKIRSEVKSDIQKSKDQNEIDKLKKQEVKISKEIDAADKKLQSYKFSEEEIKLAAILKNYKSATTRLKNNTGTEKGVKTHKSALDKFIKSAAFKKIKKEIHGKQMINLGNSFDERKAAVNATYGIDANGFDTESVMKELADFDGADINQIVASVELSKNPELFAVYLGDDPKQAKFMTAQEAKAAQQLKSDPNFVAHESYEWVMLGPKNGNNFLNSKPKKAVEYFPDFARQYKEKTGKLQGVPQETSIMGAMRDSGAVILELPKQEQ